MIDHSRAASVPLAAPAYFSQAAAELVQTFVAADLFAGTVLIAAGDETLLRAGFGLADREWNIPHVPEGKFRVGSLTKQFTAAAILQLMEAGQLALDDKITRHCREAPQSWNEVSLRHLLTHSSGIPSYTSIPGFFERIARLPHRAAEIVALTRDAPLQFPPGSQFKYNNGGYVILGHVIEGLTGLRYEDYVAQNIWIPLGLTNTGYDHDATILPFRARGYRFDRGRIENAAFLDMSVPHAAGAIYSTADDLLAWLKALNAGKPISAESVGLMFRDNGHGYGMGFAIQSQFSRRHLIHAGGINGFSVVVSYYPDADLTFIVLANLQGAPVQKIARDLAALYFGVPDAEVTLDPALLADYVGLYQLGDGMILRVSQEGSRLFAEWAGRRREEAIALDDHHFKSRLTDWMLSFEADGVALASRAILTLNGHSWSGQRIEE